MERAGARSVPSTTMDECGRVEVLAITRSCLITNEKTLKTMDFSLNDNFIFAKLFTEAIFQGNSMRLMNPTDTSRLFVEHGMCGIQDFDSLRKVLT
jgi:hypothetical protein